MTKILIIGDIILDHYIIGDVNRISPEAPVPILEFKEEFYRLGGAANVANNINAPGHEVVLRGVGGFGNFATWERLIKGKPFYSKIDLNNKGFLVKTRYAANHHYLLRVDKGDKYESSFMSLDALKQDLEASDIVVVSDYNKGTITDEVISLINRFKDEKRIIVDSKNYTDKRIFFGSYLITPNTDELKRLLNTNVITDILITRFIHTYDIKFLLHTKGHEGMTLYWDHGKGLEYEDYHVVDEKQVVDVTGAGDTVVATIAEILAQRMSLHTAIKMANLKASIVVQKFGTATIEG